MSSVAVRVCSVSSVAVRVCSVSSVAVSSVSSVSSVVWVVCSVSVCNCTCALIVSLFIGCTMRCEIWAQPAELPW